MRTSADDTLSIRSVEAIHHLATLIYFRQHGTRFTAATIHNIPVLQIHNLPSTVRCIDQGVSSDAEASGLRRTVEDELAEQQTVDMKSSMRENLAGVTEPP